MPRIPQSGHFLHTLGPMWTSGPVCLDPPRGRGARFRVSDVPSYVIGFTDRLNGRAIVCTGKRSEDTCNREARSPAL